MALFPSAIDQQGMRVPSQYPDGVSAKAERPNVLVPCRGVVVVVVVEVEVVGGWWVLHDDMYMTPQGRFDLQSCSA